MRIAFTTTVGLPPPFNNIEILCYISQGEENRVARLVLEFWNGIIFLDSLRLAVYLSRKGSFTSADELQASHSC